MLDLMAIGLAAALAAEPEPSIVAPRVDRAAIERAVRAVVPPASPSEPVAEPAPAPAPDVPAVEHPGLSQEITVTDWLNEGLVLPDYDEAVVLLPGLGSRRGGNGGSPSFDELTREFWWE